MTQPPSDQLFQLALEHQQAARLREAEEMLRRILDRDPRHSEALLSLAVVARKTGRSDLAVELLRKAIGARPDFAEAHSNLGNALKDTGQLDEAIPAYRRAIALNPGLPEAHNNLANSLKDKGEFDEAIAEYRRAIQLNPEYASAHTNLGMTLLLTGQFPEGWIEYEWRVRLPGAVAPGRDISQQLWEGGDLAGRRILLHAEQGLGDTIQFIRFVPSVIQRGGQVLVQAQPELIPFLRQMPGVQTWVAKNEPLPPFDLQCPLLSLPRIFGTTLQNIPRQNVLHADAKKMEQWRHRIEGQSTRLKVGLVWAGSRSHRKDRTRSIPLSLFAPFAAAGVDFFSLQKGEAAGGAANPPAGMPIIDWTNELYDFADTAGLVANLDVIISVDTAVAHLAATMGKPVWLLLPYVPDWRWMMDREDSPWYTTMRLFRQKPRGDWEPTISRAANALLGRGGENVRVI